MESKVPGWIERVLGIKQEEVQAQLHDLEHRIVSHVAQEWPKSVSKAAAILRLSLLKEGMTTGVTKEVRPAPLTGCPPGWGHWFALRRACQEGGENPG